VKFKAALLAQENPQPQEDIKEVWFPGNHGDIGGGWTAVSEKTQANLGWWKRFLQLWRGSGGDNDAPHEDRSKDAFQLSDIALKWMIDEIMAIPGETLKWNEKDLQSFRDRFAAHSNSADPSKRAIEARMHDTMAFGGGSSWGKTVFWNFMEFLPLIKRWEYYPEKSNSFWTTSLGSRIRLESARDGPWSYTTFPLNFGGRRDIPPGALIHHSVLERMMKFDAHSKLTYRPNNELFVKDNESVTHKWHLDQVSVEGHRVEEDDAVLVGGRSSSKKPLLKKDEKPLRFVFARDQTLNPGEENREDWIYRVEEATPH